MIYNTRNRSNDTTESQKEKKDLLQCSFSEQSVKNHGTKSDVGIKKFSYAKM